MINTQLESWITRIFSPCAVWTSPLCICGQRFQWFLRLMLHKDENMARKYKKRFISLIIHRTVLCNIKVNPSSRCFLIHILNDEDVSGFVCSTRWWNAVMASSSCPEIPDHHRGNYSRWEFRPRAASRGGVYWSSPQSEMVIFLEVRPDREPKASTFLITSIPSFTLPKTTCRPSSLNEQRRLIFPQNSDIIN